jgi:hypothetical protein
LLPPPRPSIHADLKIVGRAYRHAHRSGVSKADAARMALETYCSLHPEVAEDVARGVVAQIIKATSEAGAIWMDNAA